MRDFERIDRIESEHNLLVKAMLNADKRLQKNAESMAYTSARLAIRYILREYSELLQEKEEKKSYWGSNK